MVRDRFEVSIRKEHKRVFRKSFPTLEEAIRARDEVLKKVQGEYAYKLH
jgi:hypothetical protein